MMSKVFHFATLDCAFKLNLTLEQYNKMKKICINAYPKETGGILIGKYSNDQNTAIITQVTGPPKDSKFGNTWFTRGVYGLQRLLDKTWEEKQCFYLGEWHFHPKNSPKPSNLDVKQMENITQNKDYNCPEPLLLIVNGNFSKTIYPYVFLKNNGYIPFRRLDPS
jgi:integrative and conjugative element protein (TIGR02256 family)